MHEIAVPLDHRWRHRGWLNDNFQCADGACIMGFSVENLNERILHININKSTIEYEIDKTYPGDQRLKKYIFLPYTPTLTF